MNIAVKKKNKNKNAEQKALHFQTEDKVTERWLCFFRKELQKWEKNGIIEIGSEGKKW